MPSVRKRILKKDSSVIPKVKKYSSINSLIKFIILIIILLISLLLINDINNLAFISPLVFYVILCMSAIIIWAFHLYFKYLYIEEYLPPIFKIYSIYDTLSFCLLTINILLFIVMFIFVPTEVSGISMESTFYNNDKLLVWHIGYEVKTDDVVIININENYSNYSKEETFYIKRVVATSGDTVYYENTNLYVNNKIVAYDISSNQYETMTTFTKNNTSILDDNCKVLSGYSIVMGDNRNHSTDSRVIGAILNSDVEGKVIFRYYSKGGSFGIPKKNINY